MRLDKLLTELGTGSRSEVKKYIRSGLVTVNGEVVKKPEQKVDEKNDTITLQDAKTAANALVANKVIFGAGDAELAAFTTAREVKTQTTELQ